MTPAGLLTVMVVAVPLRLVDVADLKTIKDDGMAVTVNVWALEVPAPGVETVMESLPTEAISEVLIVVVAWLAETKPVARATLFQSIDEEAV